MTSLIYPLLIVAQSASPAPADPAVYGAGARVPAEFSLRGRDAVGVGRTTPIFDHYPPEVSFEGGERRKCKFFPGRGGMPPGETRRIEIACDTATREGQTFAVFERGRPVGRGTVLARD